MKKIVIIVAIVVVLLGALTAGGVYLYLQAQPKPEVEQVEPEKPVLPPKFHRVNKIVLSLPSERYLLMDFSLKLTEYDAETDKQLEEFSPVIRNATLSVMGRKPLEQLVDSSFLSLHQADLKATLEQQLADNGFALAIDQVLITKLVVQ